MVTLTTTTTTRIMVGITTIVTTVITIATHGATRIQRITMPIIGIRDGTPIIMASTITAITFT